MALLTLRTTTTAKKLKKLRRNRSQTTPKKITRTVRNMSNYFENTIQLIEEQTAELKARQEEARQITEKLKLSEKEKNKEESLRTAEISDRQTAAREITEEKLLEAEHEKTEKEGVKTPKAVPAKIWPYSNP